MSNDFETLWSLGYERLIPIVPPGAPVFSESSIAKRLAAGKDDRGKVPGILREDGTWLGLNHLRIEARHEDLERWAEMGASTGIRTGDGLIAIDIDTIHPETSKLLYDMAREILGPSRPRVGRHPKVLLPYRAPLSVAFRCIRFQTPLENDKRHGLVEVLAEGRQFVAAGDHPITGKPYRWPQGIPARADLPEITEEQLETFMAAVEEALPGASRSGSERHREDVPQEGLVGDPELVREAVAALPNDGQFDGRDEYIQVAYAIRAAIEDEQDAWELFEEWLAKWPHEQNWPGVKADWGRMKRPYSIGANWLYGQAEAAGWEGRGKQFFDAIGPSDVPDTPPSKPEPQRHDRFQLVTIDEVMTAPDPEFLVNRYLPMEGFGILYGQPGSRKSFIALDLALHLAYGRDTWHGDAIRQRPGAGVLYIAGEGKHGFKARVAAWQRANRAEGVPNIRFMFQHINFMQAADVNDLKRAVHHAQPGPLSLIVVDTVSRAIPGADENLQKDMSIFVTACEALREQTGAFVLGIHHESKAGDMRGSSVFLGQADAVFRMTKAKKGLFGHLICEKQKDAEDGWQDPYRFDAVAWSGEQTSLVPQRMEPGSEVTQGMVPAAVSEAVLGALHEAWEANLPLSLHAQAKGRYVGRVLAQRLSMAAGDVMEAVEALMADRVVLEDTIQSKAKTKGLRVDWTRRAELMGLEDETADELFE